MTQSQKLDAHRERLITTGRCFVLTGREMADLVESAKDAEVAVTVRWNSRGWWVIL